MADPAPRITIRRAAPDEAAAIAGILQRAFVEYEARYTPAALAATTPPADEIARRIAAEAVWVAVQDGRLVGTVGAMPRAGALYVRSMAVLPTARGRQIGERLLAAVEAFAAAGGYDRLFLSTTPFLTRAIRLYEQWGFRRSPDGPHVLHGTPLLTMVKTLAPPAGAAED